MVGQTTPGDASSKSAHQSRLLTFGQHTRLKNPSGVIPITVIDGY